MLEIVTTRETSEGVLVHDPEAEPRIADQPPAHGHGLEADISEVYGILSDPARRREYDHKDARHARPVHAAHAAQAGPDYAAGERETLITMGIRTAAHGIVRKSVGLTILGIAEILADAWLRSWRASPYGAPPLRVCCG